MKKEKMNEERKITACQRGKEKGEWNISDIRYPIFNDLEQSAKNDFSIQILFSVGEQWGGICKGYPLSTGPPGRAP